MTDLSILQIVPGLHPSAGGPSRNVVRLSEALSIQGEFRVSLLAQSESGQPYLQPYIGEVNCQIVRTGHRLSSVLGVGLRSKLAQFETGASRPALIHSHGLWTAVNHWASEATARWMIPLVCQPRGMLEPWALKNSGWKKKFAMHAYQRRDLDGASLIVATSKMEYESIRRAGFNNPVAVIPNGVDLPECISGRCKGTGRPKGVYRALFLSRIHPIKGLENLLQAWAALRPDNWRLVIAGPDEEGHLAEIMELAHRLGIAGMIDFREPVYDSKKKEELFSEADIVVLPSHSENFGLVVAEALAAGLPVLTTKGTPWHDLKTFQCGWWVDTGVEPLLGALAEATAMEASTLEAMGRRGRDYVKRYAWNLIAEQMVEAYRWVLQGGAQPGCVHTD